jgi:hypothetical protein
LPTARGTGGTYIFQQEADHCLDDIPLAYCGMYSIDTSSCAAGLSGLSGSLDVAVSFASVDACLARLPPEHGFLIRRSLPQYKPARPETDSVEEGGGIRGDTDRGRQCTIVTAAAGRSAKSGSSTIGHIRQAFCARLSLQEVRYHCRRLPSAVPGRAWLMLVGLGSIAAPNRSCAAAFSGCGSLS